MTWNLLAYIYLNIPIVSAETMKRTAIKYISTADSDGMNLFSKMKNNKIKN
jgi:hypothetical protein